VQLTVEITDNIKSELRCGAALAVYVVAQLFGARNGRRYNSQQMEITPCTLNK
jgi:hypothetical protein